MDNSWNEHSCKIKQEDPKTLHVSVCGRKDNGSQSNFLHLSCSLKRTQEVRAGRVSSILNGERLMARLKDFFQNSSESFQIPARWLVVFGVDSLSGLCALLDLKCLIIWPLQSRGHSAVGDPSPASSLQFA